MYCAKVSIQWRMKMNTDPVYLQTNKAIDINEESYVCIYIWLYIFVMI